MKQVSKFLALILIITASIDHRLTRAAEVGDSSKRVLRLPTPEGDLDPLQYWITQITRPQIVFSEDVQMSCRGPLSIEVKILTDQLNCESLRRANTRSQHSLQCISPQVLAVGSSLAGSGTLCRDNQMLSGVLGQLRMPMGFGLYVDEKTGTGEARRLVPNPKLKQSVGLQILVFDRGPEFDVVLADLETLKAAASSDGAFRLVASPQKFAGSELNADKKNSWAHAALLFLESQSAPKWMLLSNLGVRPEAGVSSLGSFGKDILLRFSTSARQTNLVKSLCKDFDAWVLARQLLATDKDTPLPSKTLDFECRLEAADESPTTPTLQLSRVPLPLKNSLEGGLIFRTKEDMRSPSMLQALGKHP